jgi:phospholipid N-methyltransferase
MNLWLVLFCRLNVRYKGVWISTVFWSAFGMFMAGFFAGYGAFFRQFREHFETTGAIAPSSPFLAAAMTRFLASRKAGSAPVRVLEIGPGTGPVTDSIVRLLRPGDVFDLVELNGEFVRILQQRFEADRAWSAVVSQCRIQQLPIQQFVAESPYDFVISGLPLNNFPAALVREITDAYFRLLKTGGVLSYFEYMYVRPMRKLVTFGADRRRIVEIDKIMAEQCQRSRICRDSVWINLPPAWVQHLRNGG